MIGRILVTTGMFIGLLAMFVGCGGSKALDRPNTYGDRSEKTGTEHVDNTDPNITPKGQTIGSEEVLQGSSDSSEAGRDRSPNYNPEMSDSDGPQSNEEAASMSVFLGKADIDDSASAVDDEIWRQFELAVEYHAMGVVANREASWEEARYYFEKSMKILAGLDIESDSVVTPEATKYTTILDNVVADFRVTLRSLGNLEEDVSSSVLIERFIDLRDNLKRDTMVVYEKEVQEVTYDIPITMNDRVKSSIVYFQGVAHDAFAKYLRRSTKYAPMMKKIIRKHGLPEDLVYLSLVESGYNPHAYSWARAMGLWQFISSTGRMYGLNRSWWMDERKDPEKSTDAACRFLKDLYEEFGHWELAMAAYNGGPGRVRRTIKKQKTIDFWKLKLRRQTMDYVPLIMAAAVIAKNPAKYGFTNIEYEPELRWEEVTIDRCLELKPIARALGCTIDELKTINPELLRGYTPPDHKKYNLKIPVGKTGAFLASYDNLPSPKETSWVKHKIRRGETVSTIASRYGVSQYAILEANNLRRTSRIYAGKQLIVPVPLDGSYGGSSSKRDREYTAENSTYNVRRGDTMWDIARAFGTSVDALRRVNYIGRGSRIYVGQKLRIPSSAKYLAGKNSGSSRKSSAGVPSVPNSNGSVTHKVRAGDTLWDIARKYGTTTSAIRRLNGLGRSSRIYPGRILTVKGSSSGTWITHRVRRGETLARIAKKHRTTIAKLLTANGITNPNHLEIGQKIRVFQN